MMICRQARHVHECRCLFQDWGKCLFRGVHAWSPVTAEDVAPAFTTTPAKCPPPPPSPPLLFWQGEAGRGGQLRCAGRLREGGTFVLGGDWKRRRSERPPECDCGRRRQSEEPPARPSSNTALPPLPVFPHLSHAEHRQPPVHPGARCSAHTGGEGGGGCPVLALAVSTNQGEMLHLPLKNGAPSLLPPPTKKQWGLFP